MPTKFEKRIISLPVIWQIRKIYLDWLIRRPYVLKMVNDYNNFFFEEISVSREDSVSLYKETVDGLNFEFRGDRDFQQCFHRIAFAALAVSGFRPKNILELGTNRGETAMFLSRLFPNADIVTVELPSDDPIYKNISAESAQMIEERNQMCADLTNVTCYRLNTAFLANLDLPDFDLIWLDAGHHYPEIAWDHFYCLSKLSPNGYLFSDDVILPNNKGRDGNSIYELMEYYSDRLPNGRFKYLLMRESAFYYIHKLKYIGYYKNVQNNLN